MKDTARRTICLIVQQRFVRGAEGGVMTDDIPEAARPVAEILRRDVPKPKDEPVRTKGGYWVWYTPRGACWPMGLHPRSRNSAPRSRLGFPAAWSNKEVWAFANWWGTPATREEILERKRNVKEHLEKSGLMLGCNRCGKCMEPYEPELHCKTSPTAKIFAVYECVTFRCVHCDYTVDTWNDNEPVEE